MGRRKKGAEPGGGQKPAKVSLLLPAEMNGQLEEAARGHQTTVSVVIRRLISAGIRSWLAPEGAAPAPSRASGEEGEIWVRLTREYAGHLERASSLYGLSREVLVQLILAENLGAYVERARRQQEHLGRLLGPAERGQADAGPPPDSPRASEGR
jgi:hypothetical protein